MLVPADKDVANIVNKLELARRRLLRFQSRRPDQTRWNIVLEAIQYAADHQLSEQPVLTKMLSDTRLLFEAIARAIMTPGMVCKHFLGRSVDPYRAKSSSGNKYSAYEGFCPLTATSQYYGYQQLLSAKGQPLLRITCGICRQNGNTIAFDNGAKDIKGHAQSMYMLYQAFLSSLLEREAFKAVDLRYVHKVITDWVKTYFEVSDAVIAFGLKPVQDRETEITKAAQERHGKNGPPVTPKFDKYGYPLATSSNRW